MIVKNSLLVSLLCVALLNVAQAIPAPEGDSFIQESSLRISQSTLIAQNFDPLLKALRSASNEITVTSLKGGRNNVGIYRIKSLSEDLLIKFVTDAKYAEDKEGFELLTDGKLGKEDGFILPTHVFKLEDGHCALLMPYAGLCYSTTHFNLSPQERKTSEYQFGKALGCAASHGLVSTDWKLFEHCFDQSTQKAFLVDNGVWKKNPQPAEPFANLISTLAEYDRMWSNQLTGSIDLMTQPFIEQLKKFLAESDPQNFIRGFLEEIDPESKKGYEDKLRERLFQKREEIIQECCDVVTAMKPVIKGPVIEEQDHAKRLTFIKNFVAKDPVFTSPNPDNSPRPLFIFLLTSLIYSY